MLEPICCVWLQNDNLNIGINSTKAPTRVRAMNNESLMPKITDITGGYVLLSSCFVIVTVKHETCITLSRSFIKPHKPVVSISRLPDILTIS